MTSTQNAGPPVAARAPASRRGADKKIRNVVLILSDQLRKDCLSSYGNPFVHTPNIDRLAGDGIRYERCYTANPLCMPSRCSIFTGMYPHNHGLWSNGVLAGEDGFSLAGWLSRHGYETANIGKLHLSPTLAPDKNMSPEAKQHWNDDPSYEIPDGYWGFSYIRSTVGHSIVTGGYRDWFLKNGGSDDMFTVAYTGPHTGGMHMPARLHCSTFIGEAAAHYLSRERDKSRPFFLTVSFPDPHFPFTPPLELVQDRPVKMPAGGPEDLNGRAECYRQHYVGSWDRDGLREAATPEGVDLELTRQRIARTYEMIELMDKSIGKIIHMLKEQGIYEETAILFTSDHGELLGDHGLWFKGPFLYDGLINVPLIAVTHADSFVTRRLVSLVDLFPSVCSLLSVPAPGWLDGISFLPGAPLRESSLIEYRNGYGPLDFTVCALVTEQDKLIRFSDGWTEYCDLKDDPLELRNAAFDPVCETIVSLRREALLSALLNAPPNRFPQICGN